MIDANNVGGFRAVVLLGLIFAVAVASRAQIVGPAGATVNPKDGLKYVWIPPGTFMMGCSLGDKQCGADEKPSHQVRISKGFWLGQAPVTVAAYKDFANATGRGMPKEPPLMDNPGWGNQSADCRGDMVRRAGLLRLGSGDFQRRRSGNTPLPRWKRRSRYGPLDEVAWYFDNSGRQPLDSARCCRKERGKYSKELIENGNRMHEVGEKRPNGFGLFDALGNVWEWVNDWYDEDYYRNTAAVDPPGPSSSKYQLFWRGSNTPIGFRVMRGGLPLTFPRTFASPPAVAGTPPRTPGQAAPGSVVSGKSVTLSPFSFSLDLLGSPRLPNTLSKRQAHELAGGPHLPVFWLIWPIN